MSRLGDMLAQAASAVPRSSILGLGVCLASPTHSQTGVMHGPPNLPGFPGWHGFSPKAVLEERLSLEVYVANDATVAAVAEHAHGAGRGFRHMVYLTLSTGIGGGVIIDNKVYTGQGGFAGELGHITIDRNGPPCNCGNVGCLEVLASGMAVARMAQKRLASGGASLLRLACSGDLDQVDARMVAQLATEGDALATAIMEEVSTNLGIGIVSLLHIFDPEIVVLGGGMANSLDLLLPGIAREIESHAMVHHQGHMPVVGSLLGDDVGLIGAGALVFSAQENPRAGVASLD